MVYFVEELNAQRNTPTCLPFSECSCVVGHKSRSVVCLGVAEQGDAFICMANPENST